MGIAFSELYDQEAFGIAKNSSPISTKVGYRRGGRGNPWVQCGTEGKS